MRNLMAILRGIKPSEASDVAQVLVEAGISQIEVPLNSPEPFSSIENIVAVVGNDARVGAGTILRVQEVVRLADVGGRLAVSPNCNPEVIRAAREHDMISIPGVLTPTECFNALGAGAHALKIFPSAVLGCDGLKAICAVLPPHVQVLAVGGVDQSNFAEWVAAGATGFGVGSALYEPGDSLNIIAERARILVAAFDNLGFAHAN